MTGEHFMGCPHIGMYLFFFAVLGFELRSYTLSHPTNPFFFF
jgi:hypothetical protein